jgi:enoyl-CoA hydratase/carnithine racemase
MDATIANEAVLLRQDQDGVAVLTLNRPRQMNALSGELIDALQAEFDRLQKDDAIRVVVIQAAGKGFCAGHDLREVRSRQDYGFFRDLIGRCSAMMMSIKALPQPVIAQVHGIATAAGCQLVAACDLAVASSAAKFATPGVNIGLFCGTPSVPLARNMASKHALDMLFTGEPIDAQKAYEYGLVSRVVAPDRLQDETVALARQIAAKSGFVLSMGKQMFHTHREMDLEQAYAYATASMAGGMMAEDARLGIDAFIEKQPQPKWRNR